MPSHRTRFRLSFRTLWVVLLALALVIQPAMAGIGELHELGHATESGTFAGHDDNHDTATVHAVAVDGGESSDPMHLLLHSVHCCAQMTPILNAQTLQVVAILGTSTPVRDFSELRLKASANDVLRPPIV